MPPRSSEPRRRPRTPRPPARPPAHLSCPALAPLPRRVPLPPPSYLSQPPTSPVPILPLCRSRLSPFCSSLLVSVLLPTLPLSRPSSHFPSRSVPRSLTTQTMPKAEGGWSATTSNAQMRGTGRANTRHKAKQQGRVRCGGHRKRVLTARGPDGRSLSVCPVTPIAACQIHARRSSGHCYVSVRMFSVCSMCSRIKRTARLESGWRSSATRRSC